MKTTRILKLKYWKLYYRDDRDIMEALCPHGVGHAFDSHGCDGCCKYLPKAFLKKLTERHP